MKRPLVRAMATGRTRAVAIAIVLASAGLGLFVGCGGERLSREEFSDRLQVIDRRGSEHWGRLAERADKLRAGRRLPTDVVQPMRELVKFQRETVGELEELNAPEGAEDGIEMLISALRERTETFEQIIEAGRFTRRQSARVTTSGDRIDAAFEQLRKKRLLPNVEHHEE